MIYSKEQDFVENICHRSYGNKKKLENQYGESIFQHFAKDVMYLDGSKHQNEKQKYFQELLEKMRCKKMEKK